MARAVPQVFTIRPGTDFATCLVDSLLDGQLLPTRYRDHLEALANLTVFVPTQRIRAELRDRLVSAAAPHPVLLPRIHALGEPWDPLEQTLDSMADDDAPTALQPLDSLRRRFMLLPLVSAWHGALHRMAETFPASDAPAGPHAMRERLALTEALGHLIDEMIIADLPLDRLVMATPPGYDPSQHDSYWEETRRFLRIAAEAWPQALAESGFEDAKALRRAALDAEARRIEAGAAGAFLLAGSTGSVPATARLMRAIARHDQGAVVLPGLDLDLAEESWHRIGDEQNSLATRFAHSQSHLKTTLGVIGVPRAAVRPIGALTPAIAARNRLVSEALRPAETVHLWRDALAELDIATATDGMIVLEASDPRREALALAVMIRETLETPGRRVALVTADRGLARRVQTELQRWNIEIEDSAGIRLGELRVGRLALLALRALEQPSGAHLLALLRHPDCRLGWHEADGDAATTRLEMQVLRHRGGAEAKGLTHRVAAALAESRSGPGAVPSDEEATLVDWAGRLEAALSPLAGETAMPLSACIDRFLAMLDALSAMPDDASRWRRHASGQQVLAVMSRLREAGSAYTGILPELREIIREALAETTLPAESGHPRASILGPLEARLLAVDRMILAGLSEGTFPPIAQEDPFLNRAMRVHLGLTPPERRIGQSAHDFQMFAGHTDLVLSRSVQTGEGPAQPSRFWRRLEALCGKETWQTLKTRGLATLALAAQLDEVSGIPSPLGRPAPVPAVPRLPGRLSITAFETLRRDPFAIYARHILRLDALDPIDPPFDARDRGTLVHRCLERYATEEPPEDPDAANARLLAIGREEFAVFEGDPARHAFWWRPFERLVPLFVAFDRARRDAGFQVFTEQKAKLPLTLATGDRVTVTGKADRLEIGPDGRLAVFDYKTGGRKPKAKDFAEGLMPQLPLTAALAQQAAFPGLPPLQGIAALGYFRVGDQPDGKPEFVLAGKEATEVEQLWNRILDDLVDLASGRKGYASRLAPDKAMGPGDYDHFARVREWDALGGLNAEGEGEDDGQAP
jgi:ATP-dependent helicase/nuclease subunit B